MLKISAEFYLTYICVEVISCTIKGCGDAMNSMIIAFIGICVVRVAYLIIMNFTDVLQIIYCYPISWSITSVMYVGYYLINKKYRLTKND